MALRLKRAYEQPDEGDGLRVLVDRLWPRGLSREDAAVDLWFKDIAPSTALRKWFGHDPKKWDEFRRRYETELNAQPEVIAELRRVAGRSDVTLIYAARDTTHNNAEALREYLLREKA